MSELRIIFTNLPPFELFDLYHKAKFEVKLIKNRPLPLSLFVTKFANYRSLLATTDNSLPQENKNTSVEK